jgi:1-acyl-sn-glycerol-3-phosphate acyltransferase
LILPSAQSHQVKVWFFQQYKTIIRFTEKSFGSLTIFLSYFLLDKTEIILTGQYTSLETIEKTIIFSNHQIYPDWFYLWLLARKFDREGDLKVMLIKLLKYIPIFGWGMMNFDFIFMNRHLKEDYKTILDSMKKQKEFCTGFPLWLIVFPEGTLNTPDNRATSLQFAKKNGIVQTPEVFNGLI